MTPAKIVLILTTTATALIAGVFYAYACSVNLGLARLGDESYLRAMQSINRVIQNPVFFASFMGTLVLLPLAAFLYRGSPYVGRFGLLLGATILYWVGVFGVTVAGNIPLNDALDRFDISKATTAQMTAMRAQFEMPWNNFNLVRTIASVVVLVLVVMACVSEAPGMKSIE